MVKNAIEKAKKAKKTTPTEKKKEIKAKNDEKVKEAKDKTKAAAK